MWFDINKYVQSIDHFLEHVAMALMGEWPPRYPEVGGSNLSDGNLKSCPCMPTKTSEEGKFRGIYRKAILNVSYMIRPHC